MKGTAKRNGEIDILRFVFSLVILLFHYKEWLVPTVFKHGNIGVEFFFVVSGFLMAKHVEKSRERGPLPTTLSGITGTTWNYIYGKTKTFFRYYISAILVKVTVYDLVVKKIGIRQLFVELARSIPVFSLTFMGISYNASSFQVPNTWYLSAMLISILILFPILLRSYDGSTKIAFPLLALFILGYITNNYGSFGDIDLWIGFCYKSVFRAIGEMALGASLCPLSAFIGKQYCRKQAEFKRGFRIANDLILTICKYACFLIVIVYAYRNYFDEEFAVHALLLCACGVVLSFSDVGYSIPGNAVSAFLGKISLPIFIYHNMIRAILNKTIGERALSLSRYVLLVACVVCCSVALMYLTDWALALIKRITKKAKNCGETVPDS